ncbi:DUF1801 domain-containing protein [Puniceicoccaceae bacterium K14]|nr:DUF1801 domain-containing protein [Puniceicoccaceae bacterium K14]
MDTPESITKPEVESVLNDYPPLISKKLSALRALIIETASENPSIGSVDETLKWGEPSYIAKHGSTIRIGAPKKDPGQYCMYFHCQTKLISTFRRLYPETFRFEGNRAIVFKLEERLPTKELKHCILLSLVYHKQKNLPPFTK